MYGGKVHGAETEGERSVLWYVIQPECRTVGRPQAKQCCSSLRCNSLNRRTFRKLSISIENKKDTEQSQGCSVSLLIETLSILLWSIVTSLKVLR